MSCQRQKNKTNAAEDIPRFGQVQLKSGAIQRLLGHENRTTTEIYLHSIGEAEREAMAVFESITDIEPSGESLTQILTR